MKVRVTGLPRLKRFNDKIRVGYEYNTAIMTAAQTIARVFHKYVLPLTPIDTGNLRKMWSAGTNLQFTVTPVGNGYQVTLYNMAYNAESNAFYANYVNDGHRQHVGQFVSGYFEGGKFRYDRNSKTGVLLKQPWVKGSFFVEKAMAQTKPQLERIVYKELQKWWNKL